MPEKGDSRFSTKFFAIGMIVLAVGAVLILLSPILFDHFGINANLVLDSFSENWNNLFSESQSPLGVIWIKFVLWATITLVLLIIIASIVELILSKIETHKVLNSSKHL